MASPSTHQSSKFMICSYTDPALIHTWPHVNVPTMLSTHGLCSCSSSKLSHRFLPSLFSQCFLALCLNISISEKPSLTMSYKTVTSSPTWAPSVPHSLFYLSPNFHISVCLLSQFSCSAVSNTSWPREPQHTRQASLSITNSRSLLKLTPIESVMPSNHFILCHPLLLLPSIFPSNRVFSNESVLCIR